MKEKRKKQQQFVTNASYIFLLDDKERTNLRFQLKRKSDMKTLFLHKLFRQIPGTISINENVVILASVAEPRY